MSTRVREALGRGKGAVKRFANRSRHSADSGNLDGALDIGASLEEGWDMYGFTVRPQHLQRYREFADIYKLEEVDRWDRWEEFLDSISNSEGSSGEGGGGGETVIDEGCLRAVKQALPRHSGVENGGEVGACPWAEKLKERVWNGVPLSLRRELWQVFADAAGAKERHGVGYYQELLGRDVKVANEPVAPLKAPHLEKWASQIEKDLPRTFPGHPILGESGMGSLRRMLTAYARHNPSVGYCQAMNFLAGLLLLIMPEPEEMAFWTLTSIIDGYFKGYYTEKMTEAQVDQLVFKELVHTQLTKLADHLETVEVDISWFSGAWFLSIFVNVLPWESVLRVWDVLLYEGNRSMLFRTALALLEMHAEALCQQRDNGGVLLMLQSMGETTFNSSQLVLSACHGFQDVNEELLQERRSKHRPSVIAALHKRSLDLRQWRTTNAAAEQAIADATNGSNSAVAPPNTAEDEERSTLESQYSGHECLMNAEGENSSTLEPRFSAPKCLNDGSTLEPHLSDLKVRSIAEGKERGTLKYQLSAPKLFTLEPLVSIQNHFKSGSYARIDETYEYEHTESSDLQEEVEELKAQVAHLKQALADRFEQEAATVQVLVHAEDARRRAIEEAEENRQISTRALRRAADELEATRERALMAESILESMENRAVMAESMLGAVQQQAAEELKAMKKRAVLAESMLEKTLESHPCSGPQTKHGMEPKLEPKLKRDEAKDNPRFRNHTIPKQDGDSAWEKRHSASKLEGAEEFTSYTTNKMSLLGRPFPLRDKNKVHAEHNEDDTHNQGVGDSTSVSLNSSPALIRKMGNIQYNSTSPELVKLQYIKRRL